MQELVLPILKHLFLLLRFRISKIRDSLQLLTLQENSRWEAQRDNIHPLENSNLTSIELIMIEKVLLSFFEAEINLKNDTNIFLIQIIDKLPILEMKFPYF